MLLVLVFATLFVGGHLLLSAALVRDGLTRAIGERGFTLAYSLLAAASLGGLIFAYGEATRFVYWWGPDPELYWLTKCLSWFGMVLLVGSFMSKNPSSMGQEAQIDDEPYGVMRITRHPLMWGIALWALGHVIANGDAVSVVFFGAFAALALAGGWHLDQKKLAEQGDGWRAFVARTSFVPLVALMTQPRRLRVSEQIGPVVLGSLLYVVLYWSHEYLAGVDLLVF
ncbi:MAG: NnrU family protein [Pseudomonadota bacterium]